MIAQRARNVLIVLIVGLLTAFGFPSGTVQGQPSERAGVRSPDAPPAAVTAAYWTRERMLAARPYPMPALQGGPRVSGVRTPRTTGPAILVAGGGPGNIARSQIATGARPSPYSSAAYPYPLYTWRKGAFWIGAIAVAGLILLVSRRLDASR